MEKANASNKPVMQHPDSHLSASSSSDSSLELSTHPKESLGDLYTKSEPDASLSPSPGASSFPDVSSQTPQWSMMSNSPRAETGNPLFPDAFPQNLEPMKSPPSHSTMDHPPGYDPNRIPKSIFSSKPTTPEWSTASNESLFSIQMGTNSFSTDYSYLLSKSQELNKPEDWKNSPYYASEVKSNDSKNLSSPLPPLIDVSRDRDGKSARASEGPGMQEKNVETPKMVSEEKPVNNNIKGKTSSVIEEPAATTSNRTDDRAVPPTEATRISSPARTSSPCHSEASGNSSSSFAFPVLVNDGAKSNSLKGATEKVEKPQSQPEFQPEKQPQHKQSESQLKAAEKSWCSCFTCWPHCC
ncbi:uncharacterized protein [Nicotiana tomentosiformis]|uniref:uncharacterized protein n=1 Tax=Nicotiana tomentosiformis TaxID=4098 RepID=UPI00051BD077|nr:pollen-specific leucine-rich repeat extensin-like protein 2 [Nicotiana tomentosiformis]XP_009630689.1 pollen-specific leucine-rich repeat extensin-like protein 2 [Nicotiana tomentosiformis]